MPIELVRVAVTVVKGTVVPGGPVNENCTVILNVLPKEFDAELLYQLVNALVRGTVTSAEANCVFVGDVKWNSALVMSRGVERPVTEMLNPLVVIAQGVTLVMTGTVGLTVMTIGAGGGRVLLLESSKLVVMVMVPATVPIITGTLEAVPNKPWLAGGVMVKVAVVPVPLANFAS